MEEIDLSRPHRSHARRAAVGRHAPQGAAGPYDDATVHGLRASFRTWAAEATDYPREIAEAALGHPVGEDVERAYARTTFFDKRRSLMGEWAQFASSPSAATP